MKHIKADRCGFTGYKCVGLRRMDQILLVSDSSLYLTSNTSSTAYLSESDLWPEHYSNINNIPRFLRGPVRSILLVYFLQDSTSSVITCYILLSMFGQNVVDMFSRYKPTFQQTQLSDSYQPWASKLIGYGSALYEPVNESSSSLYYNYTDIPGILTPLYQASGFNPISAITTPVTVNSNQGSGSQIKASRALARTAALSAAVAWCKSGCGVTARFKDIYDPSIASFDINKKTLKIAASYFSGGQGVIPFTIYVAPCTIKIGDEQQIVLPPDSLSTTITFSPTYSLHQSDKSVLIFAHTYLTVTSDSQTHQLVPKWKSLIRMDPSWLNIAKWLKTAGLNLYNIPIAKVTLYASDELTDDGYYWCVLKVQQLLCGPLLLRDSLALIKQPSDSDTRYVLYSIGASTTRGWMPLVLCAT